jgi:Spy/CpxP family protein refolding chaperone
MGCEMKGGKAGCGMHGGGAMGCDPRGAGMPGCGMHGGMGPGMGAGRMRGAVGCGGPAGRGMAAGPMMPMLEGLDLTAEQQAKLADIQERQARQAIGIGADLRLAAMDLQKLVRAEAPDREKINAQIDKMAQLRVQMQKSRIATLLEVRSLLTPDQLKKWHAGPMEDESDED